MHGIILTAQHNDDNTVVNPRPYDQNLWPWPHDSMSSALKASPWPCDKNKLDDFTITTEVD